MTNPCDDEPVHPSYPEPPTYPVSRPSSPPLARTAAPTTALGPGGYGGGPAVWPGSRLLALGAVTIAMLLVDLGVAVWSMHLLLGQRDLLDRAETGSLTTSMITDAVAAANRADHVALVAHLATAAVFISWLYVAHRAAASQNPGVITHGSGWAIGGWFVPFLNLVRPYQMTTDAYNGAVVGLGAQPRHRKARRPVQVWWGLLLLAQIGDRLAATGDPTTLDSARAQNAVVMGAEVVWVLAAVAAIVVVARVSSASDERRAQLIAQRAAAVAAGHSLPLHP
ncbi:MAG: DUF4328 domain-containing protein [Jatrophihabitans sp.]|uniref:DUF4328 domain-containing protein n=1 Tax=Jatrophihabitans sp. TaxID=1932789 RepID=UPI003F803223